MRIMAIPGSLRRGSLNRQLLRAAAASVEPTTRVEIFEHLGELPLYDQDLDTDNAPATVWSLRHSIAAADAVLIATPEYNSSVPGPLKNALDWASRPRPAALTDKAVAVVGASPSRFGAVWAQAEVRRIVGAMGANVLERELPVAQASEAFGATGHLADPSLQRHLAELLDDLTALAADSDPDSPDTVVT